MSNVDPSSLPSKEKLWDWDDRKEWLPRLKKNPCTGTQPGCPEHEQLTPEKLLDVPNKTLWQGLACMRTWNVVQVMFQVKLSGDRYPPAVHMPSGKGPGEYKV